MKHAITYLVLFLVSGFAKAQSNPAITSWLINTSGLTGRHYVSGNPTPIQDNYPANVQSVQYSGNNAYISASGIPSYIVGPYLDGNPSQATNNSSIYKIPLNPVQNTGTKTNTPLGTIGIFINGVALYDCKDAFSYKASTSTNVQQGDGVWNRDAIVAERAGFDCSKGHPSPIFTGGPPPQGTLTGGNYHHHQNPSAFNLDKVEISNVCDLYLADGLYLLDSTQHAPLIGFAFDGFPVYGAFGYANPDGTGGIKRIQSSWKLRNITTRTTYWDGTSVAAGPAVISSFPLGIYREDYEYNSSFGDLDEHNGRFCITPEYPAGTYAYFATIDENWNSAYPYVIGPTYYGVVSGAKVTSISESVTTYNPPTFLASDEGKEIRFSIFPNPAADLAAIQINEMAENNWTVQVFDAKGSEVIHTLLNQGSTLAHLDTRRLYNGVYFVRMSNAGKIVTLNLIIEK